MSIQFKKASKQDTKLRMAIYSPSGFGKTFTALGIAQGLGENIAVIDSEEGASNKYSDFFDFQVAVLPKEKRDIQDYVGAMDAAANAGFDVVIIDSMTHAWQQLLKEIDELAEARFNGNTFRAWAKGTPKQRSLVDAILTYPGHVLATIRTKTEWVVEQNEKGKPTPRKVGLAPEQGKGIEYEFDILASLSQENSLVVEKDRTGKFQGKVIAKPGKEFGQELANWLTSGVKFIEEPQREAIDGLLKQLNGKLKEEVVQRARNPRLTYEKAAECIGYLETQIEKYNKQEAETATA